MKNPNNFIELDLLILFGDILYCYQKFVTKPQTISLAIKYWNAWFQHTTMVNLRVIYT